MPRLVVKINVTLHAQLGDLLHWRVTEFGLAKASQMLGAQVRQLCQAVIVPFGSQVHIHRLPELPKATGFLIGLSARL